MRRQMNADELADFYRRIGAALWHVQYLEDVLVNFLVEKIIDERRCNGQAVTAGVARTLLADKRRLTLGPLIKACSSRRIIRPEHGARFEAFKIERHWLVHRSVVENGDDLYDDATCNSVFNRISAVRQEAISLKRLVAHDFESWMTTHGVDLDVAQNQAEKAMRKLKGV